TDEPYPTRFQVIATGTDLAKLPIQMDPPLIGTVTAKVEGNGEIKTWEQGSATAHVDQLSLTWKGEPIRTEGPLDAGFSNGLLTVQRATILAAGSSVSLQGTIPVEPTAPAGDLTLHGTFDLASLVKFAPESDKPISAG